MTTRYFGWYTSWCVQHDCKNRQREVDTSLSRAAGAGPVGQAMAGPLLTIRVKYCDSTSFLVDSLPRGARTMLYIPADRMRSWAWFCVCALWLHRTLVRRSRARGATINGMARPGTQAFPVYAVRYNTRTRR